MSLIILNMFILSISNDGISDASASLLDYYVSSEGFIHGTLVYSVLRNNLWTEDFNLLWPQTLGVSLAPKLFILISSLSENIGVWN